VLHQSVPVHKTTNDKTSHFIFGSCSRTSNMRHCELNVSNLRLCQLNVSNMRHCQLKVSNMRHCQLNVSDMRHCQLNVSNKSSCNLSYCFVNNNHNYKQNKSILWTIYIMTCKHERLHSLLLLVKFSWISQSISTAVCCK